MRRALLVLALLLTPALTSAQGVGLYIRPVCTVITNPVAGSTYCFDSTLNGIRAWDASTSTWNGALGVTRLHVPGPDPVLTPDSGNIMSIGPSTTQAIFELYATNYRSNSSSIGARVRPTLYPAYSGTGPGTISGDGIGAQFDPIIHINQFATYGQNNTHKYVPSVIIDMPALVLTNPSPDPTVAAPVSTDLTTHGFPQEVFGLKLDNTSALTQNYAYRGVWSIFGGGGLPSMLNGALWLTDSSLSALQNIKGATGAGTWYANVLRIDASIYPSSTVAKNSQRDGWAIYSKTTVQTDTAGQHDDLGNAYFLSPTITNNGATPILRISTVRVGDAPTTGGTVGTEYRALWVGTGNSTFDGNVDVTTFLRVGTTVTSGVGTGDLVIPNNTGQLLFVNAAGTSTLAALRADGSNRLNIGEGAYSEILMGGQVRLATVLQANLGTPTNGTIYYCSDCTTASACTGGGTGAFASRQNAAWKCL